MLVKVFGAAVHGVEATTISIEVNVGGGVPAFALVGLPDNAVRESYERVRSALTVNKYNFPNGRVIVNMAPADIRKEGAAYDLPLAVGLAAASNQVKADRLERFMLMGELSLDGTLQPVRGVLPIAIQARAEGYEGLIVPKQNAREAAVVNKLKVYGADTLREVRLLLEQLISTSLTLFAKDNWTNWLLEQSRPSNSTFLVTSSAVKVLSLQIKRFSWVQGVRSIAAILFL